MAAYRIYQVDAGNARGLAVDAICCSDGEAQELARGMIVEQAGSAEVWKNKQMIAHVGLTWISRKYLNPVPKSFA